MFLKLRKPSAATGAKDRYKVAIVAPTCFYYQIDLYRALTANPRIELQVYFCSTEGSTAQDVRQNYKVDASWGLGDELFRGYEHKFLKNYSPFPSYLKSIVGLANFGIWNEIKDSKPDVVVVMSWMNPTWWLAILACLKFGISFLYMTDANFKAEQTKSWWKAWVKKLLLGRLLFRFTTGFLCAGTANKNLYRYFRVPEEKLVPFAYSWGYDKLTLISSELRSNKTQLRADMGIPEDHLVFLFCGRLIYEKGTFDLLEAYRRVETSKKTLIFVGDGEARERLENYVAEYNIDNVVFAGFQNRQKVPEYYTIADAFVLPSHRDTWGIVVTEALCFNLPIVTSDQVGASVDLLKENYNGFTFPAENSAALASKLQRIADMSQEERLLMGSRSRELVESWMNRNLANSLDRYLDFVFAGQAWDPDAEAPQSA